MAGDALKPRDVLLALKLALAPTGDWTQQSLAEALSLSQSQVSEGLRRLEASRLYSPLTRRVVRRSLLDFLIHGVPYAFPARLGERKRGLPTAWSASPLRQNLVVGADVAAVWPWQGLGDGAIEGIELAPLDKVAPAAAMRDPTLYECLALVDALRAGRARERNQARAELESRLMDR